MSDELPVPPPLYSHQAEEAVRIWVDPSLQGHAPPALTPEETRAIDMVYSRPDEQSAVAGLFGLWASTALLTDLAQEHFHLPPPKPPEPRRDPGPDEEES